MVLDVCLSSSRFSDLEWKFQALDSAKSILKLTTSDEMSQIRLELRQRELLRLYPCHVNADMGSGEIIRLKDLISDPALNVYSGEIVLSLAQDLIERNDLAGALAELETFQATNQATPSALKSHLMNQITFLQGKIHRFAGKFQEAEIFLHRVLKAYPASSSIISGVIAHLVAVYCELGDFHGATNFTRTELNNLRRSNRLYDGRGRRFRLADAETNLMKALWSTSQGACPDNTSLSKARSLYEALEEEYRSSGTGKVAKLNKFRTSAGLAMTLHLEERLEDASLRWQSTLEMAQTFWGEDFGMAISLYSLGYIAARLDRKTKCQEYLAEGNRIFRNCGRQYFLVGLGSLWFDLVVGPFNSGIGPA